MGKKLLISILFLLLCACSQNNNSKDYLSTQYVNILKSGNYYLSYMDPTMTNDHTPVIMEIARKELLSAVRYDMNGSVISSIADNQALTFIVNGEVINQVLTQEYKDALGSDSLAPDFSDLVFSGASGQKEIDGIKYYFETFEYHARGDVNTIDFMYTDDCLQAIVFYRSRVLLKNPTISTTYPEDLFLIPEAHANYQTSSSAPAQRPVP